MPFTGREAAAALAIRRPARLASFEGGVVLPCHVETDPVHGLVVVRAEGEITAEDIVGAIRDVWREPSWLERPHVLWDLRKAGVSAIHTPEVRRIVSTERQERPEEQVHTRMALLASTDVGFGMARVVAAMVADQPIAVRVFRDDEAEAWSWLEGTD
jgi:hypothetical protein